jgi:thioredoxin 1
MEIESIYFQQELKKMSEQVRHITDTDFDSVVLKSDVPVLVDFWAQWCGPCKMIAPILEEIAPEYAGKLIVTKMDVDSNTQTPTQYGIRGIPTLMIFKNGELIGTKVGALSKSQLKVFIDTTI